MNKNKGIIIVLDGIDSCGKATQSKLLFDRLPKYGCPVKKISFPNYNERSSELVKLYLEGKISNDYNKVNPYAASLTYALDRHISYKTKWKKYYDEGHIIIADRYTTSNMIHQTIKLKNNEKMNFIEWLKNIEYNLLELPKPDLIFFLDMNPLNSIKLMKNRKNKFTNKKEKDIHEKNKLFLTTSYKNALWLCDVLNWIKISCENNNNIKKQLNINNEIYKHIITFLSNNY